MRVDMRRSSPAQVFKLRSSLAGAARVRAGPVGALGSARTDWAWLSPTVLSLARQCASVPAMSGPCARHGDWRARAAAGERTYVHVTGGACPVQDKAELDWSRKC
jgi:hypothetical protein